MYRFDVCICSFQKQQKLRYKYIFVKKAADWAGGYRLAAARVIHFHLLLLYTHGEYLCVYTRVCLCMSGLVLCIFNATSEHNKKTQTQQAAEPFINYKQIVAK